MAYADEELNAKIDSLSNRYVPPVAIVVRALDDLAKLRERWHKMEGIPRLFAVRSAAEDNSFLCLDVRTLLRGEESGGRHAVHSIILPPGAGIPAHGVESGWHGSARLCVSSAAHRLRWQVTAYLPLLDRPE